jgi:hypothetical protein
MREIDDLRLLHDGDSMQRHAASKTTIWLLLATLCALGACIGEGSVDNEQHVGPDADASPVFDTGPQPDTQPDTSPDTQPDTRDADEPDAPPPEDTGPPQPDADSGTDTEPEDTAPDPCDDAQCGANASCRDGACTCDPGYDGDPLQGCAALGPCVNNSCDDNSWCDEGQCRCVWGFTAGANGCERDSVSIPENRSQAEVCAVFDEMPTNPAQTWLQQPQDQCDWGMLHPEYHHAALATLNMYRWLVGLEAVGATDNFREITQACATTLAAEDAGLTHDIPSDYACYTSEAASGAASSNLGTGYSAISSVRGYIEDWMVPSLGHRRWVFNPTMQNTGFGWRDGYTCMQAFDYSGSADPDFVAYPAPGYFPDDALHGPWSLTSSTWGLSDQTEVTITRLSDGEDIGTHSVSFLQGRYVRKATLSFRPKAPLSVGEEHEVRFTQLTGSPSERSFNVTLVDC